MGQVSQTEASDTCSRHAHDAACSLCSPPPACACVPLLQHAQEVLQARQALQRQQLVAEAGAGGLDGDGEGREEEGGVDEGEASDDEHSSVRSRKPR